MILFRINSRNNRDNKHYPKNMQIKKAKSYLFSPVIFLLFFCLKSCNFDLNRLRPRTKAYSLISSNLWHLTQNGNYLVDDCGIIVNHYSGHLSLSSLKFSEHLLAQCIRSLSWIFKHWCGKKGNILLLYQKILVKITVGGHANIKLNFGRR